MEKPPSIAIRPPSPESSPATDLSGEQLESSTATAHSTPTVLAQGPSLCRDYVKEDDEGEGEEEEVQREAKFDGGASDEEKSSVRQRESVGSFGSVQIADQMSVPPAGHIHPS